MNENAKSDNEYWPNLHFLVTAAMAAAVCFSFYTLGYRWGEYDATKSAQAAIDRHFKRVPMGQQEDFTPSYRACRFASEN